MPKTSKLIKQLIRPDTPAAQAWRRRGREAGNKAYAEALARFGPVTPTNANTVLAWIEARRKALMDEDPNP